MAYTPSADYITAMSDKLRNRAYITASLGLINQIAQQSASVDTTTVNALLSDNLTAFTNENVSDNYATFEKDFVRADGFMFFPPETSAQNALKTSVVALSNTITIDFSTEQELRGLTLEFVADSIPLQVEIIADDYDETFDVDGIEFSTSDYIGSTESITIIGTMADSSNRLRLSRVKMGVGLNFNNNDVVSADYSASVSQITSELPRYDLSLTILDKDNQFIVDDETSIANFLRTGQKITVKYGMTLSDDSIEYIPFCNLSLSDWNVNNGQVSIKATDDFAFMTQQYTGGSLTSRTLYDDAYELLHDELGLDSTEYEIDNILNQITVTAPLPSGTIAECLQLIASAGRCVLIQDADGKIIIKRVTLADKSYYELTKDDILNKPSSYKEQTTKDIFVKIFTYKVDEQGNYYEYDDHSYCQKHLNDYGETQIYENPLVTTQEMASDIADWLTNYYKNNISYSAEYRGEPCIDAGDIIGMESDIIPNLVVDIESASLTFNGAFKGHLDVRRNISLPLEQSQFVTLTDGEATIQQRIGYIEENYLPIKDNNYIDNLFPFINEAPDKGRPSSANLGFADGKMRQFKATSSMTEGKPDHDGTIVHFAWDSKIGAQVGQDSLWDAELFIPNNISAGNSVGVRGQQQGVWENWIYLARDDAVLHSNGEPLLTGMLKISPTQSSWREGIRIKPFGSWTTILLGGTDLVNDSGTSPNSWSIHNQNGTFYITRNGSDTGTAQLKCASNVWYANGNALLTSVGGTLTDNLFVQKSTEPSVGIKNASGREIRLMIGAMQTNRGIFDTEKQHWLFHYDDSKYYVNGDREILTSQGTAGTITGGEIKSGNITYKTRGGICMVCINNVTVTTSGVSRTICSGLPANRNNGTSVWYIFDDTNSQTYLGCLYMYSDGTLHAHVHPNWLTITGYLTFTYFTDTL